MHIRRVKEFRFREIARPTSLHGGSSRSSTDPDDTDVRSVDNLVTVRVGGREGRGGTEGGSKGGEGWRKGREGGGVKRREGEEKGRIEGQGGGRVKDGEGSGRVNNEQGWVWSMVGLARK